MVDEIDKKTYFPRSFNEQMAWMDEEVEHIIKYNEKYQIKKKIQEQGREAYGMEYTHVIKRLFEIIKADPKNKALMREVNKAEQELIDFLYDAPGALPEKDIFIYWNNYLWAYTAELEAQRIHYFIVRGYDNFNDSGDWIGIYHAWHLARDAYNKAVGQLEREREILGESDDKMAVYARTHEKIMVHIFDETEEKWSYNVNPQVIFKNKVSAGEEHKEIE